MRRALTRKLTAGLAIAAVIVHVAALSLHIAMIASLALAGDAVAGERLAGFVICSPDHRAKNSAIASVDIDVDDSNTPPSNTTTFCPACNGATAPALVLPDASPRTVLVAMVATSEVAITPAVVVARHEAARKQSRGPPHQVRL